MKKQLIIILVAIVFSCDDFGDKNVDPNNPTKVPVAGFLTSAIHGMAPAEQELSGLFYSQFWSETRYTTTSRYSITQYDFTTYYSNQIRDLEEVIRQNTNPATREFALESGSNNNQIAVASILKAYYILYVTDRWGDVPYSDVNKAEEGVITPRYDTQESIYTDLFQKLKDAVAQIDSGLPPKGDVLYKGNMDRWKKFANSLRLRMALRLSKVDPDKAQTEFINAYNDGVISSQEEQAAYLFLGDGKFDNPAYTLYAGGRIDYAVSNTMINFLKLRNDPRVTAYADTTRNKLPQNKYLGMPYGLTEGQAGLLAYDSISLPNSTWARGIASTGFILTEAQVCFMIAEGALNNWITADVKTWYEKGIRASFEQWGVFDQDDYDAYILDANVAYTPADAARLIGEQKWAALYMQGYEAWAEWRRTGFPALLPAPAAMNNSGKIPVRQAYPSSEALNNSVNYNRALEQQGPDVLDTPIWWDKQ